MSIKRVIFDIIQPDNGHSVASRMFDWMITGLIVVSVASVFAVTFELPDGVSRLLRLFESIALMVFTIEYLLRLWTADMLYMKEDEHRTIGKVFRCRMRFVFSAMAIIDLMAILPFLLPMVLPSSMVAMRAPRLLRLLRILKLNRYFDAMSSIVSVLHEKKRELVASLLFVGLLMLVSSLLMYSVEHDAQPDVFKNAFSGLWWSVATLTTVGYGDIYPVTVLGRVLGALIAFSGIAALAIPTGIITSGLMDRVGKCDVAAEAETRSKKDEEHDRELREQRELISELNTKIGKLLAALEREKNNG